MPMLIQVQRDLVVREESRPIGPESRLKPTRFLVVDVDDDFRFQNWTLVIATDHTPK